MKSRTTLSIAIVIAIVTLLAVLSACDKTDPTDSGGGTSTAPSAHVVIGDSPNSAGCLSGTTTCSVGIGISVKFNGAASSDQNGPIKAYDWTYGDGATARTTTSTTTHPYTAASSPTYTVSLKVWDDGTTTDGTDCPATLPAFGLAPCTSSLPSTNSATVTVTVTGP